MALILLPTTASARSIRERAWQLLSSGYRRRRDEAYEGDYGGHSARSGRRSAVRVGVPRVAQVPGTLHARSFRFEDVPGQRAPAGDRGQACVLQESRGTDAVPSHAALPSSLPVALSGTSSAAARSPRDVSQIIADAAGRHAGDTRGQVCTARAVRGGQRCICARARRHAGGGSRAGIRHDTATASAVCCVVTVTDR